MKKIKFILSLIIVISVIAVGTAIQSNAAEQPTFSINTASGNAGEEVEVTLNCSNNPGINGWAVDIGYDSNALQIVKADGASVFGDVIFSQNINENPFHAQWFSLNDSTVNGKMITLTFKIKDNAKSGDYELSITYNEDEVVNIDEENVHFNTVNGVIKVQGAEPATSEPLTTAPVVTEPATTEPLTTEPVVTEPATTEPLTTAPVVTDPATSEPLTTAPVATEPATTEPLTTAPVATEHSAVQSETTNQPTQSSASIDQLEKNNPSDAVQTGESNITLVLFIVMLLTLAIVLNRSKSR